MINNPPIASTSIPNAVVKTGNETVNNSDVLQNDDELKFAIGANQVWTFEIELLLSTPAAQDIKICIAAPTGASGFCLALDSAAAAFHNFAIGTARSFVGSMSTQAFHLIIKGIVVTGATAGDVQLQWAQVTAGVADTIIYVNSNLIAHRLK